MGYWISHSWSLTLHLSFKFKFKVRGRCTGFRPEMTSARIPRLSQTTASLQHGQRRSSHNHDLWPDIWPSRSNSRSKNMVPDILPKWHQHAFHQWFQATDIPGNGSLHNHDLWPGIWPSRSYSSHCQAKCHGCVIYSGKLTALGDHFGRRADVISDNIRYPAFYLEFDIAG